MTEKHPKKEAEKPKFNFWLWLFFAEIILNISNLFYSIEIGSDFIIAYLIRLPFAIILLFKMFNRKKGFVTWAMLYLWIPFIIISIILFFENPLLLVLDLSVNIVWTIYLKSSERVKRIFVE